MNSVEKAREAEAKLAEERPEFFQNNIERAMFRCGYVFGYEARRAEEGAVSVLTIKAARGK